MLNLEPCHSQGHDCNCQRHRVSRVKLAALFQACIEAFDLIQISRNQEVDFKKLKLRLNIEKCRLYVWAESMGFVDDSKDDKAGPIDRLRFPDLVQEVLEVILQLFRDSQKIQNKYGCRELVSDDVLLEHDYDSPLKNLDSSFSDFHIPVERSSLFQKPIKKMLWVIHDRAKFKLLITEIKDLIDSLPSVSTVNQVRIIQRRIGAIRDPETLSQIAEVCSEEYPDISDAATLKADTMSLAFTQRRDVNAWNNDVEEMPSTIDENLLSDLESLTLTELKHKLLELIREREEREAFSSWQDRSNPRLKFGQNCTLNPCATTNLHEDQTTAGKQRRNSIRTPERDSVSDVVKNSTFDVLFDNSIWPKSLRALPSHFTIKDSHSIICYDRSRLSAGFQSNWHWDITSITDDASSTTSQERHWQRRRRVKSIRTMEDIDISVEDEAELRPFQYKVLDVSGVPELQNIPAHFSIEDGYVTFHTTSLT